MFDQVNLHEDPALTNLRPRYLACLRFRQEGNRVNFQKGRRLLQGEGAHDVGLPSITPERQPSPEPPPWGECPQ